MTPGRAAAGGRGGGVFGRGRGGGGPAAGPGMGGRGRGGGPQQQGATVPEQNGLIIHGFAESDTVINEFVENLRNAQRVLPSGWYLSTGRVIFSEATVQQASWNVLYNATEFRQSQRDQGAGAWWAQEDMLFSFTVEVQFKRTRERPAATGELETAQQPREQ